MPAVDSRVRSFSRVLGTPSLRRLAVGYGLFGVAEDATWLAITVYAFARGGVTEAGVVAVVQLVPAIVVAPFAAYAGDRFRRDVVLAVGYAAQAATMVATAAVMWADGSAVAVYVVATAAAVAVTFTRPAIGAVLPAATSSATDLTATNVTLGALSRLSELVGPAVAALLLQGDDGPARVFAVMGVATGIAAVAACRLRLDPARLRPVADIDAATVVDDAFGGFRTLRHERDLRLLIVIGAAGTFLVGATDILYVTVADELVEDGTAATAGFLAAAAGLGGVLGAFGSVGLVGRRRLVLPMASAVGAAGLAVTTIAAMSHTLPIGAAFAVYGAGRSVSRIALKCLIQRFSPGAVLARVFGIVEGLEMAGMALGSLTVVMLSNLVGLRAGIVVLGLTVPVLVLVAWRRLTDVDAAATTPDPSLVALVTGNPIFAGLPPAPLAGLLEAMEPRAVERSEVIVRQGDEGDDYYFIRDGQVVITVDGVEARRLGPGEGFGEIALVRDVPRTATATAATAVRMMSVDRDAFTAALSGFGLTAVNDLAQRVLDADARRQSG